MGSSKSACCLSGLTATLRVSYDQVPDFKPNQCNRNNLYCFSAGLKKTSCKAHSKKEEMFLEQMKPNFACFWFLVWIQIMREEQNEKTKPKKNLSNKQISSLSSLSIGYMSMPWKLYL